MPASCLPLPSVLLMELCGSQDSLCDQPNLLQYAPQLFRGVDKDGDGSITFQAPPMQPCPMIDATCPSRWMHSQELLRAYYPHSTAAEIEAAIRQYGDRSRDEEDTKEKLVDPKKHLTVEEKQVCSARLSWGVRALSF